MARFGHYGEYLKKRWDELGGEAATEAVRRKTGARTERDMPWGRNDELAQDYANQFKAAQMPIFVRIAGELHHTLGHRDVGLGHKAGGNHYMTANGPIATDILVLKDLDGSGHTQLVDCFSSMGGPESKPLWNPIEENADRTWLQPPVPEGAKPPKPSEPPPSTPSADERFDAVLTQLERFGKKLDALETAVKALAERRSPEYEFRLFGQSVTLRPKS